MDDPVDRTDVFLHDGGVDASSLNTHPLLSIPEVEPDAIMGQGCRRRISLEQLIQTLTFYNFQR